MFSEATTKRGARQKPGASRAFTGVPAAVALGFALLFAVAPNASGTPFTYTFTGGSSIQWQRCNGSLCGAGPTDTVTGSFTYDASDGDLTDVDVTLTGSGPGDAAGNYTLSAAPPVGPSSFAVFNGSGFVTLAFTAALAGIDDTLDSAENAEQFCLGCGGGGAVESFTATGGVDATPAAVPEPTGTSILAAALGLFLLGRRVLRRIPRGPLEFLTMS